mmetsp:Transcript_21768/g.72001  ORF Transcript_21768/g.72001 Transcript_21768/m.72001 type:complete len:204 (+) Transcript_21768:1290-1901(+)
MDGEEERDLDREVCQRVKDDDVEQIADDQHSPSCEVSLERSPVQAEDESNNSERDPDVHQLPLVSLGVTSSPLVQPRTSYVLEVKSDPLQQRNWLPVDFCSSRCEHESAVILPQKMIQKPLKRPPISPGILGYMLELRTKLDSQAVSLFLSPRDRAAFQPPHVTVGGQAEEEQRCTLEDAGGEQKLSPARKQDGRDYYRTVQH